MDFPPQWPDLNLAEQLFKHLKTEKTKHSSHDKKLRWLEHCQLMLELYGLLGFAQGLKERMPN